MEQVLVEHARASPERLAVIDEEVKLTYRQLMAKADALADMLQYEGIELEEPICIYIESGYKQALTQVAVLRAGGTCVPVEPSVPPLRLADMLHDIEARYIITCDGLASELSEFRVIHTETIIESQVELSHLHDITLRAGCGDTHRSHIIFTSGSTGRPKPIQVLACGILHVLYTFPNHLFDTSDCMSQFINPGFDFSLFEIWGALLSGVTLVAVPKKIIVDPVSLGQFLETTKIKTMIIPTALFNTIALTTPDSFRTLRHVLVGGEALNASAMRKVLKNSPPENLWNAYGPAEATIYVTLHRVDLKETDRPRISIGKPLGQTKVYLLDKQCRPITDTEKWGEICISGPQLSPGYLNRPKQTKECFIQADAFSLGTKGSSIRLYRTGDIGQWRDKIGLLDYIGRSDKQVKRFGHRVELGDIERTFERHPHVYSCVAALHQGELSDVLAVYIITALQDQVIEPNEMIQWAEEHLPPYMVPNQIERLQKFPLTENGKVDRKALRPRTVRNRNEENHSEQQIKHHIGTDEWLQSTIERLLSVPGIDSGDNLFDRGLSSLQAAQLISEIMNHSGRSVTLEDIYEHPTVEGLLSLLHQSGESKGHSNLLRWEEDSHLADDIIPVPDWQSDTEGHIFLTGATGFVGAYLLNHLLCMESVKEVACLARSHADEKAITRVQKALKRYCLWDTSRDYMKKVYILDGELADETLGLTKDQYQWLADWASIIFHVGAKVNWCDPYDAHFKSNVLGTRNIIRLACQGRRRTPLHYLSSIDAWNVTGFINKTKTVLENERLKPHMKSLPYDMGYAQSQWVADEMVQRVRSRGLPVAIYRPGFVIGDSQTAIGNPDDFFARLIIGCIHLKYFPHLPNQRLEYVTVDYVCSATVHIASKMENLGGAYHLVSPDPTQSVNIEGTYKLLKQAGYSMEEIPYHDWVKKVQEHPDNPLVAMLPMLQEPVFGEKTRMETSTETPVYDTRNTVQALANQADIKYIPLNHELLRRYVEFWVDRHYYKI
ncbi:hypothetical protein BDV23DRAFT_188214 [Aspergillus alliaceus]|uniref:Carrier domain-containing protein n=1 Tax=Petromyces alliaceus TaxID=209559 RepID=A0A5N7BUG4_PETAA|nr:hypothetical protein BDV23DRAFT_188214 [Aspergillus alliaceus]